jgi:curved DNA-binding protein
MDYKDYYKILGINKSASEKEIKQAYRKLARKHHPDVNPNNKDAEKRFKEINEAYAVLSDPEKRKTYDTLGPDWQNRFRTQGAPGGTYTYTTSSNMGEFSDFFESLFGGAGQRGTASPGQGGFEFDLGSIFGRGRKAGGSAQQPLQQKGADIEQPLDVTLLEAFQGSQRTFTVTTPDGQQSSIDVKIPKGIREGSKLRVKGRGNAGFGGAENGDLYLVTHILPDPRFRREGDDLYVDATAPLTRLVLGGEAQVPTLTGPVTMKIPAGSQNGRTFKLTGQGMPRLRGEGRGDLYVKVAASLPTTVNDEQRELFQQLAATGA